MTGILAWLIGSKIGRWVASAALLSFIILLAIQMARKSGAEAERAKANIESLKRLRERVKINEDVSRMPSSARRDWLRQYWDSK